MIKTSVVAGLLVLGAMLSAPAALADTPDPHMPNGPALWCQGGMGNVALAPYCDGTPYLDGSFWHQTAGVPVFSITWNEPVCVGGGCPETLR